MREVVRETSASIGTTAAVRKELVVLHARPDSSSGLYLHEGIFR